MSLAIFAASDLTPISTHYIYEINLIIQLVLFPPYKRSVTKSRLQEKFEPLQHREREGKKSENEEQYQPGISNRFRIHFLGVVYSHSSRGIIS